MGSKKARFWNLALAPLAALPTWASAQVAGRFAVVQGEVLVERGGTAFSAAVAMEVGVGDVVRTGPSGRAKLLFEDGSVLNLGDDSRIRITQFLYTPGGDRSGLLDLVRGTVRAWVTRLRAQRSGFKIQTPTAVAGVRGTDYALRERGEGTVVVVFSGEVTVRSADPGISGECVAQAGMSCELRRGQPVGPAAPAPADLLQALRDSTRVASLVHHESVRLAGLLLPRIQAMAAFGVDWPREGERGGGPGYRQDRYRGRESRSMPGEGAGLSDPAVPTRLIELNVRARVGGRY